jgi:AcrR family transcriptional regulator
MARIDWSGRLPLRSSKAPRDASADSETQERILDAACHEFSHGGYRGTTMREIAERAGVGHPLINYYFDDKDGLWRAAAERLYGEVGRMLDESVEATRKFDDEARIRHILVEFVLIASQSRLLSFLVETSEEGGERTRWLWERWVKPAQDRIREIVEEGQALGLIVKANPELVYQLLTGFSLADSTRALFPGGRRRRGDARTRAEEAVAFLMHGE